MRAGLVLVEQISTVLPSQETYHVGYVRDEETLQVSHLRHIQSVLCTPAPCHVPTSTAEALQPVLHDVRTLQPVLLGILLQYRCPAAGFAISVHPVFLPITVAHM